MKRTGFSIISALIYSVVFSFISIAVSAQSSPKIQQVSVRAPANIKIDGKLTEWDNKLQAYNRTDEIWYTISNDDERLYLAVLVPNGMATDKFIICGLTFTISHSLNRKATDNVAIAYPLITGSTSNTILMYPHAYVKLKKDSVANAIKIDSVYNAGNITIGKAIKEMQVTGIKGIDSVVSVYNDKDIRVVSRFDQKMNIVLELAVPLKYLGFSVNDATKFSYNIQLNGFPVPKVRALDRLGHPEGYITDNPPSPRTPPLMVYLNWPVDFWGEYALAKK